MLKIPGQSRLPPAPRTASQAGAAILRDRLEEVARLIPLAAQHCSQTTEHVHQLRVSSRRAVAAIDALRPMLPRREAKRLRKTLSQLRRRVGQARELDVLLEYLERRVPNASRRAVKTASKHARRRRAAAQAGVVEAHRHWSKASVDAQIDQLLTQIRWRGPVGEPAYRSIAIESLRSAASSMLAAAADDLRDIQKLHALRIEAKRFRYTLELARDVIAPSAHQAIYRPVKRLQKRLGIVNDHDAARNRLTNWAEQADRKKTRRRLKKLARVESRALKRSQRKFLRWWAAHGEADFGKCLADAVAGVGDGQPAPDRPAELART